MLSELLDIASVNVWLERNCTGMDHKCVVTKNLKLLVKCIGRIIYRKRSKGAGTERNQKLGLGAVNCVRDLLNL